MRDIIEMMEDAAESRFVEMTKDVAFGYFRCGCGHIEKIENAQPFNNNPYSDPICGFCWDEWEEKQTGR